MQSWTMEKISQELLTAKASHPKTLAWRFTDKKEVYRSRTTEVESMISWDIDIDITEVKINWKYIENEPQAK